MKQYKAASPATKSAKHTFKKRRSKKRTLHQKTKRLETHFWHSKRFHMEDQWGYRVPIQTTSRSQKEVYRNLANGCVAYDSSYMSVVKVTVVDHSSKTDSLFDLLRHFVDFRYPTFCDTKIHYYTAIHRDSDQVRPIAPCHIMGKKANGVLTDLWFWVDPQAGLELEAAIKSYHTKRFVVRLENNEYNRFELIGPKAAEVIANSVQFIDDEFQNLFESNTTHSAPSNLLLSAVVKDPRIRFMNRKNPPPKPSKQSLTDQLRQIKRTMCLGSKIQSGLSLSELWNDNQDQLKLPHTYCDMTRHRIDVSLSS